jgi:hypothetical protein
LRQSIQPRTRIVLPCSELDPTPFHEALPVAPFDFHREIGAPIPVEVEMGAAPPLPGRNDPAFDKLIRKSQRRQCLQIQRVGTR